MYQNIYILILRLYFTKHVRVLCKIKFTIQILAEFRVTNTGELVAF